MPELDGLEATRRILAADAGARILILTTFDLDEYVYEALRAGASGFVLKDDPPEQLIAAIRTVAARRRAALAGDHQARDHAVHAAFRSRTPPTAARRADRARARGLPPDRPAASRTPRSAASSTSATRPSRRTSRTSSRSSTCATACRRSCSPTRPGFSRATPSDAIGTGWRTSVGRHVEDVAGDIGVGVRLHDLRERVLVGHAVAVVDALERGIVEIEEAVAVAQRRELPLPDRALERPQLGALARAARRPCPTNASTLSTVP